MKNEQWGWGHFNIKRQLDNSELARFEDYRKMCHELWYGEKKGDYEPKQETWRVVNQGIRTV